MEVKKSKKADLEGQKSTSMLIGYIFALGAIFAAFEWTTREYKETEPVVFAAYAQMEESTRFPNVPPTDMSTVLKMYLENGTHESLMRLKRFAKLSSVGCST